MLLLAPVAAIIIIAIAYVGLCYLKIHDLPSGTKDMLYLAKTIRHGAITFIRTEFRSIFLVVIVLAIVFSLFVEKTAGLTFAIGACMSSIVCTLGMRSATLANVRTTNRARESLNIGETVKVALTGGSISGLSVHAFGLLGLIIIYFAFGGIKPDDVGQGYVLSLNVNASIIRLTTYSLGCSIVAMFNRVAGGNYTKAADISSDILAKIRHDLPEDDSRVPNVIADFIGDNVNDIAGNCSDLLESFVATIIAAMIIAATLFSTKGGSEELFNLTTLYPILVAGGGLLACTLGLFIVSKLKMGDDPSKILNSTTYIAAILTMIFAGGLAFVLFKDVLLYDDFRFGWVSPWISTVLGVMSGVFIGLITEYYTSTDFNPTKNLAKIAPEGTAFVVTKGDAIGSRSTLLPILVVGVAIFASGKICGNYGIAMAALGMLSFVGVTVSIDAFGPIADNAGGIAESCHLPEDVRKITDKLDAVGNTTAAIGKGFAIGSAALATVSLITAYVGNYNVNGAEPVLNFASFVVVAGGIIGGGLIEYFSAMLTDNTIEAAKKMADVGDEMMTAEVIEGKATPDYNKMIRLAANEALRYMLVPSLLAMLVPVVGGFLFGVEFVGGVLVGATIVAIPRAIFMGNSGGAFDNAKKYIESGALPGHPKKSDAHKAAVNGDTIGDTRKDVVGVALDIFIKMMSTVANTLAPIFSNFTFFR